MDRHRRLLVKSRLLRVVKILSRVHSICRPHYSRAIAFQFPSISCMSRRNWVVSQSKHFRMSFVPLNVQTSRAVILSSISLTTLTIVSVPDEPPTFGRETLRILSESSVPILSANLKLLAHGGILIHGWQKVKLSRLECSTILINNLSDRISLGRRKEDRAAAAVAARDNPRHADFRSSL
jgi:hypothetical protein